jgi:hypothetical protein
MYEIGKINNLILIEKGSYWWKYIIFFDKKIQIWIGKDLMRILECLINFIKDLITRKNQFLESMLVLIGVN